VVAHAPYVREAVRAYWLTLEHGLQGEVYNIGSGVRRSAGEMLESWLGLPGGDRVTSQRDGDWKGKGGSTARPLCIASMP